MKTITFTEFRKNASGFLSDVEQGDTLLVLRHGKPIAEVCPVNASQTPPAWKRPALRLATRGTGLAEAILEERDHEDLF